MLRLVLVLPATVAFGAACLAADRPGIIHKDMAKQYYVTPAQHWVRGTVPLMNRACRKDPHHRHCTELLEAMISYTNAIKRLRSEELPKQ